MSTPPLQPGERSVLVRGKAGWVYQRTTTGGMAQLRLDSPYGATLTAALGDVTELDGRPLGKPLTRTEQRVSGFGRESRPVHDREAKAQREGLRRELERIADGVAAIALRPVETDRASRAYTSVLRRLVEHEERRDSRGRPT